MRIAKWLVPLFLGAILIVICTRFLLGPDFSHVDFTGLREQLAYAFMKPITMNLDGSPASAIEPRSAEIYSRAGAVGLAVSRHLGSLPARSSDLAEIEPSQRLDPWSRPFCIMDLQERVAVITEAIGDDAGCTEAKNEIMAAHGLKTGILYRSSRGAWIVLVPRSAAHS